MEETIVVLEHKTKMVRAEVTRDGGDADGREVWWVEKTIVSLEQHWHLSCSLR